MCRIKTKYAIQTNCMEIGVGCIDSKRFHLSVVEVDGDEPSTARISL